LLEAHRLGEADNVYRLSIDLTISSKPGKLINMMKIFTELNVPVLQVMMKNFDNNLSLLAFETEFSNPGKVAFLLNSLKKYDDSLKVIKKHIT
jgi:(p)ppGpp synthase/HD superfamily hydrolase